MADEQLRHSKSEALKRVVRRRDRRRKPGANSGQEILVHIWHGRALFKPSGAGSVRWLATGVACLVLVPLLAYLAVLLRFLGMIALADDAGLLEKNFAAAVALVIFLAPFWITGLIAWVYVRLDGNTKESRARLTAAADRLREKRDAEANRGT